MIRAALLVSLTLAGPALAQSPPAEAAQRAARSLETAAALLDAADGARDRVAAFSETVRAYEAGLAALRDGIRRAAVRERALMAEFESDETRLTSLLGALLSMQTSPEALSLLHPSGPVDSARAGMILADVTPAIAGRVAELRVRLDELKSLRTLQENAAITLRKGLEGVQAARTELSRAISDRSLPPDPAATDLAAMAELIGSADTLDGFAASLATLEQVPAPDRLEGFSERKGTLPLPATGAPIAGFRAARADGIARPGLTFATEPRALVTTPHAATIRYAGPLLDHGLVTILEPEPGILLILSGLGEVYGGQGDIVEAGEPVGLMGGAVPHADQILIETAAGTGQDRSETLYIEIRQGQVPVDPADWFALATETGR